MPRQEKGISHRGILIALSDMTRSRSQRVDQAARQLVIAQKRLFVNLIGIMNIPPRQCTKTGRIEHRFR